MRVLAFVKTIPDPEAPQEAYRFEGTEPDVSRVSWVLGPFEQNALEVAIQIGEGTGGEVLAVAFGGKEQEVGLRRALAVGAAEAVRVVGDERWLAPLARARRLKAAVDALGPADVYVFGRQAGDWDQGVTAGLVAGLLDVPFVPLVRAVTVQDGRLRVVRERPGGQEEGTVRLPCVLSVTNGPQTVLRIAKVRDVMMANRKAIRVLEETGDETSTWSVTSLRPNVSKRSGRKVTGSPEEVAEAFVAELKRLGVLGGVSA
jgi:electron transfer flavoprotein beta subunit